MTKTTYRSKVGIFLNFGCQLSTKLDNFIYFEGIFTAYPFKKRDISEDSSDSDITIGSETGIEMEEFYRSSVSTKEKDMNEKDRKEIERKKREISTQGLVALYQRLLDRMKI